MDQIFTRLCTRLRRIIINSIFSGGLGVVKSFGDCSFEKEVWGIGVLWCSLLKTVEMQWPHG